MEDLGEKKVQKKTIGNNPVTESHPFNIARVGMRETDVINQVTEVSRETLPHIQELFDVIQTYFSMARKAGYNEEQRKISQNEFRDKLQILGIADKFDWSNNER